MHKELWWLGHSEAVPREIRPLGHHSVMPRPPPGRLNSS
jgi:hypothetical protein